MTANDLKDVLSFEKTLTVGQVVEARWTNNGKAPVVPATVVKINQKSVIVTLNENTHPEFFGGWREGQRIKLERFGSTSWSYNNGVFPLNEQK